MTITYHETIEQGSDEWYAIRCGLLTASEMKFIITPTLKVASNEKERTHLYELAAQRITKYVEPQYVSDDMIRGKNDEIDARIAYEKAYEPVREVGFITNDNLGFTLGYSPDALVGDDGLIECKSRRQKFQIETIVECLATNTIPDDYRIQVQTGLLVSGRKWCDFVTYCGGLPMATIRVFPDPVVRDAIIDAATKFEARLLSKLAIYETTLASKAARLIPTERRVEQEITL